MVASPNRTRAKISAGPNAIASRAIGSATAIMTNRLKRPPNVETMTAVPMATLARPCFAIGCPSSTVAAAEGVPGMPSRMAETEPPVMPPI